MPLLSSFLTCSPPVNHLVLPPKHIKTQPLQLGFPDNSTGKESACNAGDTGAPVQALGWEDSLKKEMATHSSLLTWRIPWTEEPSRLQSMELQSRMRTQDTYTFKAYPAPAPPRRASAISPQDCVNSALPRLPAQFLSPERLFFSHTERRRLLGLP